MHLTISRERPGRVLAIGEALVVTVIWASSFIFVKVGLAYMGPLTMAGIRYVLAFLLLLPLLRRAEIPWRQLPASVWVRLSLIGVTAYTLGNGMLYWGLRYLSATTSAFLVSLTPLFVLAASLIWLREIPARLQWIGVGLTALGSVLYFTDGLAGGEPLGLLLTGVSVLAFTVFGILGREIARDGTVGTLMLTALPLGLGGLPLFIAGPLVEGWPTLSWPAISIVLWLAVVNSAIAYLLYNHALQVLTAVEMNVTLNLSLLVTAAMSWLFLQERFVMTQVVGIIAMAIGVALVQLRRLGGHHGA